MTASAFWAIRNVFGGAALLALSAVVIAVGSPAAEAAPSSAIEKNYDGYPTPNHGRSKFLGWMRRDLSDRIPGEETLFKQYEDEWGFQFESLTINGIRFAYNLDIDGKFPYDITLIDTDCDGIFETKVEEKPGERVDFAIPECVFSVMPVKSR